MGANNLKPSIKPQGKPQGRPQTGYEERNIGENPPASTKRPSFPTVPRGK